MLRIDELVRTAREEGARTLHLAPGAPALARFGEGGLQPLDPGAAPIPAEDLMHALSVTIEPEKWPRLEAAGGGEVTLQLHDDRPAKMNVFRAVDGWRVVVHL